MERDESPQRVLVVDDEPAVRDVVARYLRDEGFIVDEAADGFAALERAAATPPDLLILDLNLPSSGVEAFRRLRERSDVPVIMLNVAKPFSPRDVVARLKAVLRRYQRGAAPARSGSDEPQRIGELEIDRAGHEVRARGAAVALTPMEFRILDVLASNLGRVFSRDQLLDKVSTDRASHAFERTLDRHIANLRQKIELNPARPRHVVTVFGVGYKLVEGT